MYHYMYIVYTYEQFITGLVKLPQKFAQQNRVNRIHVHVSDWSPIQHFRTCIYMYVIRNSKQQ